MFSPFGTAEKTSAIPLIKTWFVSCAGRDAPRTGRSLACLTLAAMLSLSPLSRVYGADMSKIQLVTNCNRLKLIPRFFINPCFRGCFQIGNDRVVPRSSFELAAGPLLLPHPVCRGRHAERFLKKSAPVPATRWRLPGLFAFPVAVESRLHNRNYSVNILVA